MKCKYCHLPAGFFSRVHKECKEKHLNAISDISNVIDSCFMQSSNLYDDIEEKLGRICTDGFIETDEYNLLLLEAVKRNIANYSNHDDNFVMGFIKSLPEGVKTDIMKESTYVEYWEESIKKELSCFDTPCILSNALSEKMNWLLNDNSISVKAAIMKVALSGLERRIDNVLEDSLIDEDEEDLIDDYLNKTHLSGTDELAENVAFSRLVQSLVLRDLQEGKKPTRCQVTGLPILLGKTENIIWVFKKMVQAYEEKTGRKYVAGSRGVSMRVCKGVYYRVGDTKGHSESYQYHADLGRGYFVITNKNIIFTGSKPVKIPISKILSYTAYSDGIELIKEAANPKSYIFIGPDAWFVINAIQLLVP